MVNARNKRLVRVALLSIPLMGALFVVWVAALISATVFGLDSSIAALHDLGEPVMITDLAPDPVPPCENAFTYLRRAANDLTALERRVVAVYSCPDDPIPAELQAEMRAIRVCHPAVIPLLEEAAACRFYRCELDYSADVDQFVTDSIAAAMTKRPAARLLHAQARLQLACGDRESAIESCLHLLRLSRHFARDPMVVQNLFAVSCYATAADATARVLRNGPLSLDSRAALESELTLHDDNSAFVWALRSERAVMLQAAAERKRGRDYFSRYRIDRDTTEMLHCCEQQMEMVSMPLWEARMALALGASEAVQVDVQTVWKARESWAVQLALIRCLRVVNAMQRAVELSGRGNIEISELGLPRRAICDPFTGDELRLVQQEGSWRVYAVGTDLDDDGGDVGDVGFTFQTEWK